MNTSRVKFKIDYKQLCQILAQLHIIKWYHTMSRKTGEYNVRCKRNYQSIHK